jgi:hypothetical protein
VRKTAAEKTATKAAAKKAPAKRATTNAGAAKIRPVGVTGSSNRGRTGETAKNVAINAGRIVEAPSVEALRRATAAGNGRTGSITSRPAALTR